jgi:DNA invertase Pin-like site-specific DNA recombinase
MKRAVLYLRVSTLDQATANQERELREIAGRMGRDIVHIYKDHGISGAKGREKRHAFDRLCRNAAKRQFDMVMAWSFDRLGRSLQDLVGYCIAHRPILASAGARHDHTGRQAMFQMMGVFAEFERAIIQERVRAGLAKGQERGQAPRPPSHPCRDAKGYP